MYNIKKSICEWFKKPMVEVSVEYTPGNEIPAIGIPARYFINALNDVDKWESDTKTDEYNNDRRKLTNKETHDVVSWYWTGVGYFYSYPGSGWMNYSERGAVEEVISKTYQSLADKKQKVIEEASRQKMFKDSGEYQG